MTMLLSTDFSNPAGLTWAALGDGGNPFVAGKGCGGSAAFTCLDGGWLGVFPNFFGVPDGEETGVPALTVRQSIALYSDPTGATTPEAYDYTLIYAYGSPPHFSPTPPYPIIQFCSAVLRVNRLGGLLLDRGNGGWSFPSDGNLGDPYATDVGYVFDSAPNGSLPIDGVMHALEMALSATPSSLTWDVRVDGTSVMSGTDSWGGPQSWFISGTVGYCTDVPSVFPFPDPPPACGNFVQAAYFDHVGLFSYHQGSGVDAPGCNSKFTTAWAHVEVEDVASAGAYTACAGAPAVTANSCCLTERPPGVPSPPPKIPLVKCAPQSIISSPSPSAGCSKGGTGWRRTYTGPSGKVPIGADPVDGETMTGKTAVHLWIEITHTNY